MLPSRTVPSLTVLTYPIDIMRCWSVFHSPALSLLSSHHSFNSRFAFDSSDIGLKPITGKREFYPVGQASIDKNRRCSDSSSQDQEDTYSVGFRLLVRLRGFLICRMVPSTCWRRIALIQNGTSSSRVGGI